MNIYDIIEKPVREGIQIIGLSAFAETQERNVKQVANMILLGELIKQSYIVKNESVLIALENVLPKRLHHMISVNKNGIILGMELSDKEVFS